MRYSPAAATLLVLFLQGCTRWTPMAVQPAALPTTNKVRATLRTGQQVIVTSPVFSGDTLKEAVTGGIRWSRPLRPVLRSGIPLAEISALEVQKVDAGATAGLVVVTGVAVAGITLLLLADAWQDAWRNSGSCWTTACDH